MGKMDNQVTLTKTKHNRTVLIYHEIYCIQNTSIQFSLWIASMVTKVCCVHIEYRWTLYTKWPSFLQMAFSSAFPWMKTLNFEQNFTEICSLRSEWQYRNIGSDKDLAPNRGQVIIHDDVIKWKHFPRNWPFVRGIHRSRWIPHIKASDAELWWFLWSASE